MTDLRIGESVADDTLPEIDFAQPVVDGAQPAVDGAQPHLPLDGESVHVLSDGLTLKQFKVVTNFTL